MVLVYLFIMFFLERMTWIKKSESKSWLRTLCENTLKYGPIPRHVAFIMDGNRRFANKNNYDRAKGHWLGFDKLAEVPFSFVFLSLCFRFFNQLQLCLMRFCVDTRMVSRYRHHRSHSICI